MSVQTRTHMLIGGEWIEPGGRSTFPTYDPATGKVIAELIEATPADVDAAVRAATGAFGAWADLVPAERARLLLRVADLVEQHADELARLETTDQGQPLAISGGFSIPMVVNQFRYHAGWATKLTGITVDVSVPDVDYRTRREPLGVCGLITPWNFPIMLLAFKLAPALATGNTVVIKPAEQTSLSTLRLAELCLEAGIPAGVVNVVTGGVGKALVDHPGVAKISFTGSTEVGREIGASTGRALKRVSLELGGKAPSVVAADADIDAAVAGNLMGGLLNSGQVCAAYTRFYVARPRADEFVDKLAAGASSQVLGHGLAETTQLGPLVSEEQVALVDGYVRLGEQEGATLVTGGSRAEGDGYFYRPTVFTDVADSMRIAREEIFGPVLSVIPYEDDDELELIARANDTDYGLAAVIWSGEVKVANRLARRIRAGSVYINMPPLLDAAAAWGGFKASGLGRENGWDAIEAFTEVKSIWTAL
ncbi:aldehyde dehydrogenase (NAD+)/betaine-aldehyde dehydrogenase [Cryptosporangium aurantiacum]|uniref:Aldehyde dehydrogenase (NAD+)/betaine-aldehyde dehydrogenase n=2 Tax=Cryptosporangium aurantiacum TaxID=134849 RepID=A0A1M7L0B7_9ACTN|nr:aldehyde dehydrogenase family protein [Cryptosporangium aurantiacum]SHM71254.1 aldehyde dehydrogenase (NAD+)/betaine-aldehyde dehydrogenase [Cryptosporangium aurantiacum]